MVLSEAFNPCQLQLTFPAVIDYDCVYTASIIPICKFYTI